jgi:hypothetical protein
MSNETAQVIPEKLEHWTWKREHERLAKQWNRARKKIANTDGSLNTEYMARVLGIDTEALSALMKAKERGESEREAL